MGFLELGVVSGATSLVAHGVMVVAWLQDWISSWEVVRSDGGSQGCGHGMMISICRGGGPGICANLMSSGLVFSPL